MAFINNSYEFCKKDYFSNSTICNLQCPNGEFALPGMLFCHTWLDCRAKISILSLISLSVVKAVYLAEWEGHGVVASVLTSELYANDFFHNLAMLKLYSPSQHIVNFIGHCRNTILTEYHRLGNALNFPFHLKALKMSHDLSVCLNICISYASIIAFLHSSIDGVRVMCDSNDLEKALSQFLLTPDLRLVLNDLDATPEVDATIGGIHCGSKELVGSLLAPEQIWPYPAMEFDLNRMPLYDEKTDIYKIPDVCIWFLRNCHDSDILAYRLFTLHKACKNDKPVKRPSADFILKEYSKIYNDVIKGKT